MPRTHRRTTITDLLQETRKDPRYDTRDCHENRLEARDLGAKGILALFTPGRDGKYPGVLGWFDFREHFNELTENSLSDVFISDHHREHYHPSAPVFIAPRGEDVTDYFCFEDDVAGHFLTGTDHRLPRTNWSLDSDRPDPDSTYYVLPDWDREADAERMDPTDVHGNQTDLNRFEGMTQAETNPDAIDPKDARIDGLPAFIDADGRDDCLSKYDSNKHSDPMACDHCGNNDPWYTPIERGVRSLRPGGVTDGNSNYEHCDPIEEDIKTCDCCGCPRCNSKSIPHRKTKNPAFRCNHCNLEFDYPVNRQTDDNAERVCLYWLCDRCEKPTQAPFAGIPEVLLNN